MSTSDASPGSATSSPMSPTPMSSEPSYQGPPASPWSISWDVRAHGLPRNSSTSQPATLPTKRRLEQFLIAPEARRSGTRTPTKAPLTVRIRRRTRKGMGDDSWPPPSEKLDECRPRAPPITSTSCSRGHAQTIPSPSNTCTRIAPS